MFALVLGLALASAGLLSAKDVKNSPNKEKMLRFYSEVINNHNVKAIDKYVTEDFVDHNPDPGQEPGVEGLKAAFKAMFKSFPDVHVKADFLVEEGDKVVAHITMTGTQKGEFMGMKGKGKKFKISGVDIVRLVDGKATDRWGNFDSAAMMEQLGLGMGDPSKCAMEKGKCPMGKCPMDKDKKMKDKKKDMKKDM
jgi:steroid delta-isomerase-like uncharacterized protein